MAKTKTADKTLKDNGSTEAIVLPKTNQPLVFISHDTRDADLAEEFSTLLKTQVLVGLNHSAHPTKKAPKALSTDKNGIPQ